MKFIIFISSRLRHGEYPKLRDFPFNQQYQRYIYQGRELTADEFNAAAKVVFDANYRGNGYTFRPEAIEAKEKSPPELPEFAPELPEFARFRLSGTDIFEGDERVGGLFQPGPHLRVAPGKSSLRADLEAFLSTQSQLP